MCGIVRIGDIDWRFSACPQQVPGPGYRRKPISPPGLDGIAGMAVPPPHARSAFISICLSCPLAATTRVAASRRQEPLVYLFCRAKFGYR